METQPIARTQPAPLKTTTTTTTQPQSQHDHSGWGETTTGGTPSPPSSSGSPSPGRGVSSTTKDTPLDPLLEILRLRLLRVIMKAESVEDGGGGDGGGGGGGGDGGDGVSVEEKQEVTANMQVKVDALATRTTTVSDSSTETSTKTTTSKITKTTKVKTIKVVKKKTTSSLVANAISDLSSRAEDPMMLIGDSPKKVFNRRGSETPPKKIPGAVKKIIKPVVIQNSSEEASEASPVDPVTKQVDSSEIKDSTREKGSSEVKLIVVAKEPVVPKEPENKDSVDGKELFGKKGSVEAKESIVPKESGETKDSVEGKESFRRKGSVEAKESVENKETVDGRMSFGRKRSAEGKESVKPKESVENKNSVEGKKSFGRKGSVEGKESIKPKETVENKDSVEGKKSFGRKGSAEAKESVENKDSLEGKKSFARKGGVETKGSVENKNSVEGKKLFVRKGSAEAKESVKSKESVESKELVEGIKLFGRKGSAESKDSVIPKESIENKNSVEGKKSFDKIDSVETKASNETESSVSAKDSGKVTNETNDSNRPDELVKSKDVSETSDEFSYKDSNKTNDSGMMKESGERNDLVKSNHPVEINDSMKSKDSVEMTSSFTSKDLVETGGLVQPGELAEINSVVKLEDSVRAKESPITETPISDDTSEIISSKESLDSSKTESMKPQNSTEVLSSAKSEDSSSAVNHSDATNFVESSECPDAVDSAKVDELPVTSDSIENMDFENTVENSESADKVTVDDISWLEGAGSVTTTNNEKYKSSDADSLLDSELDNVSVFVIVRDMSGLTPTVNKVTIVTPATSTCGELMQEVGRRFKYEPDSFSLVLQCSDGDQVEVDKLEAERTLAHARFQVEDTPRNNLILCDLGGHPPRRTDEDDLSLGASASPTANATERKWFDRSNNYDSTPDYSYPSTLIKHDTGYVGLVNQAMTCYLNSLLQTLYMTPEFRNALYQWEFLGSEEEASKNIPCQLQRLFLLLQTTNKSAVETTNLTKSFGWDSSEAWQQHDIQELCRVMFDALEQCFKNTHQSNLINNLYEGKMKDYVKCLDCKTEGAREDTYLDIPLPIRPFGSSSAYRSVEEALKAFVEPELLTGNNKYKCSKCDALCDAHKGLKFIRFPYLLTIHLMRFDFDYQTLHRIKLNDKVTFPNILDLNSFVESATKENGTSTNVITPDKSSADKVDDASTTDSGSALDVEDNSVENTSNSQPESDNQDEDEGIDVSSMYNEKNKTWLTNGPYVYELFSIMVHSGSASGGHYYAYIKDFATEEWFCFNDQSVTKITYDDIKKTYGGNASRGGYYSSWSSSANAYMLMYRQIAKDKNVYAFTREHLPQHIKDLVQRMTEEEAAEREQREMERCTCRIKLFCQLPGQSQMVEKKLRVHKDSTLRETTKLAYKELGLENTVPLERCRLVKYEEFHDSLECSFEGQEDELISEILGGVRSSYKFELLMEIRDEDKTFEVYKPGGTTIKAHVVNLTTEEVEGPYNLRGSLNMTVRELKELLGRSLNLNPDTMRVVLERYYNDLRPLTSDTKTLKMESFYRSNKVYLEASGTEANDFFTGSCMYSILDRYENTITLYCPLPDTSKEALEELQIPPYKEEEVDTSTGEGTSSSSCSGMASTSSAASPADSAASPASCSSKDSGISSKAPTESSSSEMGSSSNSSIFSPSSGPYTSLLSTSSTIPPSSPRTSSTQGSVGAMPGATATTPTASPTMGNSSDGEDEGIADADSGASSSNVNSDQSASEDSSLTSDSDRTLVGDPPEDKLSDASNSPDYRNVSSPEDNGRETKGDDSGWGLPIFQDNDVVWGEDEKEVEIKRYFRAEYFTEEETNQKMLRVYVDKRITIGQLKTEMQPWVGVSQEHFKLFKIYSNSQEFECTRMTETLASYGDNTRLSVRLGRALLPGEQRGKVYLLEPENIDDPARFLIDWVVCKGDTIAHAKKAIIKEVNARCNMSLVPENVRLRKKSWKNPQTIYLDNQKFDDDINLYSNWELFLQVIEGPETRTNNTEELAIFVKRWKPSTYATDSLIEIIIPRPTVDDLKGKLSEISGIEAENIEFAKGKGTFPCDMSVMDITNDLDWTPRTGLLDQRPLFIMDDGAVVYFRDKTESLKELTEEERRELVNSENRRLNRDLPYTCPSSSTSNYSTLRSKEKGLKIYLNHEE
ncbi:ubiquitin carboxyl-terminal hydrolase 47 isoform X4 [Panulirus ornatus]|uniref:ubiquitin carboxyl-terminal hydrolase 47 isoform X4 n=2 Tax=Panulirus ornatus TaxID=150431 RepID=UPI003A8955E3